MLNIPRLPPGSYSIALTTAEGTTTWTGEGREIKISPLVFYFPVYPSKESLFMGYALANSSTDRAVVNFELFGRRDHGFSSLEKPDPITLEPGDQLAKLSREIFSDRSQPNRLAWARATTDSSALAACSLLGNLDYLDGSGAVTRAAGKLYFTRIKSVASGDVSQRAATFLSIANPSSAPVRLKLTLFSTTDRSGTNQVARTERILPSKGLLYERVADLFDDAGPIPGGYVEAEVLAGAGVVGFQLVEFSEGSSLIGLNPWEGNSLENLYSARVSEDTWSYYQPQSDQRRDGVSPGYLDSLVSGWFRRRPFGHGRPGSWLPAGEGPLRSNRRRGCHRIASPDYARTVVRC